MKGPFDRDGVRWWVAEDVAPADAMLHAGRALRSVRERAIPNEKSGRRKALYRVPADAGKPAWLFKSNSYSGLQRIRRRLLGSKSRGELRMAEALAARGIETPTPWIVGEEHSAFGVARCWCLVPVLEDVVDLRVGVREAALTPTQRRALAEPFGAFAAELHRKGFDQDDFSPNNFLVRPGTPPSFWPIDFERAKTGAPVSPERAAAQLAKLWRELMRVSTTEARRFLRGYAAGREAAWAERIHTAARARTTYDWKRLHEIAAGDERRFHQRRDGSLTTWYRDAAPGLPADADLTALAAAPRLDDHALWVPLGKDASFTDWVTAHLLAFRDLAPPPLAFFQGPEGGCLLYRAPERARVLDADQASSAGERAAIRSLQVRVGILCSGVPKIGETLSRTVVLAPGPEGRLRADWLDPRGLRPHA